MKKNLADLRREYALQSLTRTDVDPDPIRQFRHWFDQAVEAGLKDPTAMALATATPDGRPSVRFVLLKDLDQHGFTFYTNFASRKGMELDLNPLAALVFYWPELERQVRIEGRIERLSDAEADAYFRTRPRGSQLSAWASPQSEVVEDRAALEGRVQEIEARYGKEGDLPRPPFWGGYRVLPDTLEFWQGRPNRLHDRVRYTREAGETRAGEVESGTVAEGQGGAESEGPSVSVWRIERLAP